MALESDGGFMSVIFLVVAWGGVLATGLAIIGVIRRRCPWYSIFMYAAMIIIGTVLHQAVFCISDYLAQPDTMSTALFWGAVFIGGIGALTQFPKMIGEIWRLTNSPIAVRSLT